MITRVRNAFVLAVLLLSIPLYAQAVTASPPNSTGMRSQPPSPPTLEQQVATLQLQVVTLGERIEYLLDLIEAVKARVVVLEARAIPTTCKASLGGVPVSCRLLP